MNLNLHVLRQGGHLGGAGVVVPGLVALEVLLGGVVEAVGALVHLEHEVQVRKLAHLVDVHMFSDDVCLK